MKNTNSVKSICRLSELLDRNGVNQNTWVVGARNQNPVIYNGNYTVDQVRGHFGKATGCGKDAARAMRLSSFNKRTPDWAA